MLPTIMRAAMYTIRDMEPSEKSTAPAMAVVAIPSFRTSCPPTTKKDIVSSDLISAPSTASRFFPSLAM